jgi:hypothetical protein
MAACVVPRHTDFWGLPLRQFPACVGKKENEQGFGVP